MTAATALARLIEMHTYQRPAGSCHERKFINRYIRQCGATSDAFGNWSVVIGDNPRHVWSSHTDTVHTRTGKQRVFVDDNGILSSSSGECLGADDTVGAWLMTELIRRGVSGRYVFHYGEEHGCIGSRNLVRSDPAWIHATDIVIALDRMHTTEVITHQCGARTASDEFAEGLADQLNADDSLHYAPSSRGMYTDSESYAADVPECTNLAVGYAGQHGRNETLDTRHALALLDRLTVLDVSRLPITRKAGEDDEYDYPRLDTHDETFWNRYGVPAYRETVGRVLTDECPDCGEWCADDDDRCLYCGRAIPPIQEAGTSTYLDRIYGDVQRALRAEWNEIERLKRKDR